MNEPAALVVEDEIQMAEIVEFALDTQGFEVVVARSAAAALLSIEQQSFDLVVLDVMLPDGSGIALCRHIRSQSAVPIIMLTALGEVEHRIAGLEAGADDYVPKPFSPRELALRAQAIVRRTTPAVGATIEVGSLLLRTESGQAFWDERPIELPDAEFRLLARLASDAGRFVPVSTLLRDVWEAASDAGGRDMVKSMVYRVRRQLRAHGAPETMIESARSRGYRLRRL